MVADDVTSAGGWDDELVPGSEQYDEQYDDV